MKTIRGWVTLTVLLAEAFPLAAAPQAKAKSSAATTAPAAVASGGERTEKKEKIEGIEIARPGGGYLGLQIVNGNFVLTFYSPEKKKVGADMVRAALRWAVKYQPNDERAVLNPDAEGTALTSAKTVRPPHTMKVYVSLFANDGDAAAETYVVDYHD